MSEIEIINFEKDHADKMINSIMNDPLTNVNDKYRDLLDGLYVPGKCFTAIKDDKIICSGGIVPVWENVFEGWVMATHLVWKNKIGSAKVVKRGMEKLIKDNNVTRLQTTVKKDFTLGHRFAKWLGMEEEGLMKKYLNNEDYIRFARVM